MTIEIVNTYGQQHETSPNNPTHVTRAAGYRVTLTGTLTSEYEHFDDMVKWLALGDTDLHTRPEGYGLVFLESEEHSVAYFGPLDQVREYQRASAAGENPKLDPEPGVMVGNWPHGGAWDDFLPPSYWNIKAAGAVEDGVGIVTAFAHNAIPGAEVIVYEYEGRWSPDGEVRKMVTYHCTGCHKDTRFDSGHEHENRDPDSRRWAARQARQHITQAVRHGVGSPEQLCRPGSGNDMLRVVNEVAKDKLGPGYLPHPEDEGGYCALNGPCSIIREMRAGVRPAPFGR